MTSEQQPSHAQKAVAFALGGSGGHLVGDGLQSVLVVVACFDAEQLLALHGVPGFIV
jgi:hypothetical protein